jgi:hypothetical protein
MRPTNNFDRLGFFWMQMALGPRNDRIDDLYSISIQPSAD